jgi:hypothetical protein
MAMGASLQIVNNTGSAIKFTQIAQVNDDATWSVVPPAGTLIKNGSSVTISMGNASIIIAPRGVGASCIFMCQRNFEAGSIYFDDPAVGAHSFDFDQSGVFNYDVQNPTGNSYVVTITIA